MIVASFRLEVDGVALCAPEVRYRKPTIAATSEDLELTVATFSWTRTFCDHNIFNYRSATLITQMLKT